MEIKIKNFGPISSFDFNLSKDLHVIYGKNNIGKSYAITIIYIILKKLVKEADGVIHKFIFQNYIEETGKISSFEKIISSIEEKIEAGNFRKLSITGMIQAQIRDIFNADLMPKINKSLKNSYSDFSNLKNKFSKEDLQLILVFDMFEVKIKQDSSKALYVDEIKIKKRISAKFIKTNRKIHDDNDTIIFYVKRTDLNSKKLNKEIFSSIMSLLASAFIETKKEIKEIYFLPASRSGLYQAMSIFSNVFAKASQWRGTLDEKIEIPALPEHVSDYFLSLSTARVSTKKDEYYKIASEIEGKILEAQIIINDETKKIEYYSKKTGLRLDLSETSSMVSEIAPIVAFLKFVINKENVRNDFDLNTLLKGIGPESSKSMIIIEEPEAHLHPNVQIILMEYFLELLGCNVKVVMTTHSNYMFNKLGNLVLAKKVDPKLISSYLLRMTTKGSIADTEIMKVEREGIDDFNFSDASETLFEERLRLEGEFSDQA